MSRRDRFSEVGRERGREGRNDALEGKGVGGGGACVRKLPKKVSGPKTYLTGIRFITRNSTFNIFDNLLRKHAKT